DYYCGSYRSGNTFIF
nr:immunoglobulin light chain junction region [Macaca mulatta]MOW66904.1 immunoglobulin light chain junction region [Macaca mulatta]MOW69157.1 immunoglobulin light chain junction region [Macaca mulatta]MOW69278.1 immunoglobulin light chain junction region [Macaca mulatta]MOW69931.1 immunoglobulin light chain junction region [Macaca mulatta]